MDQQAKDLIAIGEERGMAVGAAQGKAELFSRLLEQKFGGLSAESRKQVAQASPAQLEAWTARLFKARSLKAIFAD